MSNKDKNIRGEKQEPPRHLEAFSIKVRYEDQFMCVLNLLHPLLF